MGNCCKGPCWKPCAGLCHVLLDVMTDVTSDLAGADTWVCFGLSGVFCFGLVFFTQNRTHHGMGGRQNLSTDGTRVPREDSSGVCLMLHESRVPSIWKHSLPIFLFLLYLIKTAILLHIYCWSFLTEIQKEPCTTLPTPGVEHMLTQRSEPAFANPISFHQTAYTEDLKGIQLWNMTATFKPVYNQTYIKVWHNLSKLPCSLFI